MEKIPTTAELDAVFRCLAQPDGQPDPKISKALHALSKAARESENVRERATGCIPALMRSITAAGVDLKPLITMLMLGFLAGCIWRGEGQPEAIPDDAIKRVLEGLERMDGPEEEGKS